jgi:hypothetical protein
MSATEVTTRRAGEDSTYTAEPATEFEPGAVEFREKSEPASRSARKSRPVEARKPAQPARGSEQEPLLLRLVDRLVEWLASVLQGVESRLPPALDR